jgi:hypothetical protein
MASIPTMQNADISGGPLEKISESLMENNLAANLCLDLARAAAIEGNWIAMNLRHTFSNFLIRLEENYNPYLLNMMEWEALINESEKHEGDFSVAIDMNRKESADPEFNYIPRKQIKQENLLDYLKRMPDIKFEDRQVKSHVALRPEYIGANWDAAKLDRVRERYNEGALVASSFDEGLMSIENMRFVRLIIHNTQGIVYVAPGERFPEWVAKIKRYKVEAPKGINFLYQDF